MAYLWLDHAYGSIYFKQSVTFYGSINIDINSEKIDQIRQVD